ncbi:tetracycline resistance protein [Fervidicella metallireducens AeB]|uniref:Tetracycline resistance protein n=1 Tax=Fervidicella metallireducens AeB TaxID=1403537 RepID=A0A017RRE9_9CLOT|nr:NYN domain-containing protein [Fervidicella metallireducens]EYE87222.1 tetracycline resistance protein [Fervidicella metallireducens AeB]
MSKTKYLFVDGYNIINSWKELKVLKDENLEDARDKLVDMLREFAAYKGIKIIVVFDAHMVKGSSVKHIKQGEIDVVFTKEQETADCYIERNVAELSRKNEVYVATSDYLEQRIVLQMGGIRITPAELLNEISLTKTKIKEKTKITYSEQITTLSEHVNKEILEKLEKMRRNL